VSSILALLLSATLPAANPPLDNLDFSSGTLRSWDGEGFYLTSASTKAPGLGSAVCSSDRGAQGRTALLHRTFVVPPNAGAIRFFAYARLGKDCEDDGKLDVVLFAAGRQLISKKLRNGSDWQPVSRLLPPLNGKPREYVFPVSNYVGQTLRLALVDDDKRPGCHLYCSGFSIVPSDEFDGREFGRFMIKLTSEHKLPPASRFDSKHFLAMSNAEDEFAEMRLHNCELIYEMFFDHFRRRGFRLHQPAGKLMLAIFDSQAGFEAYLGHKMPPTVTGVYHLESNRLLVYDYGTNDSFVEFKKNVKIAGRQIGSELDRMRFVETENRRAREFRTGVNIGTVMHEVAHQLSFNTGLLNREGDVPIWLAEGLACYCEATDNLAWQGIGEPNQERLFPLAAVLNAHAKFFPLRDMLSGDGWLREQKEAGGVLLAYAQSWALFRMLMEERPEQFRRYLALTYPRRNGEHRLIDFGQSFGSDLDRLELRFQEYIKEIVERYYKPRR
jgi:hypothetical protein